MKTLVFLVVLGISAFSYSQNLTIFNEEDQKPVKLAYISSLKPNKSIMTNENGSADISGFEGAELIYIQAPGFESMEKTFAQLKEADYKLFLKPLNFNLDAVTIAATRWRQNINDLPQKVERIKQSDNLFLNPQTAADLLGSSSKIFIQKSQQGGGSPMIRGFATNRLLYTVDGVRMNTAIFRSGNIQNVISMDPFATESMEVMMGPGSVNYGSDAIGGVMNINTLTPQLSTEDKPLIKGKAAARFSTANMEKTGHFDINVGWKKFAFVTSVSYWDFENLKQGAFGPDEYVKPYHVERIDSQDVVVYQDNKLEQAPSAYSQFNIMQKIRYKPGKNWNLEYGFHYSETSSYGRYDRHNRMKNGLPRYAEWYYGPQKWMMNNLSINHSGSNAVYDEMTLRIAQQSFAESRHSRNFNNKWLENNVERVDAYSANLDFKKGIGLKNTLFYGVEYVMNDVKSSGTTEDITSDIVNQGPSRYPNSKWHSISVYVNDEYRISEKFTLQAGIRYTYYILRSDFSNNKDFYPFPFETAELNNGALTGSIGFVYKPTKKWAIRANFGTAFRSPNVDDIGKIFDSEPGAIVVPNPDLKAEYAYSADLGITKVFGDIAKIELDGYYTYLDDALVRRDYQLNGQDSILYGGQMSKVQAIQNAANAYVYGVMFHAEFKLPKGFGIAADFNWQEGIEEMDDGSISASRHAAPIFGAGRFSYTYKNLKLEAYVNYQGGRIHDKLAVSEQGKDEIYAHDENGETYVPSWYTLNFKAMYTLWDQFHITAGIENITNVRYRPYSSGISGAGRNFIFGLSWTF
ncbi:MAG: TonB-dependent receptor [Crocinitomicaceae bacterium]|nr:TonB-dependent receptor [Crocinitomicaceae bacterium]